MQTQEIVLAGSGFNVTVADQQVIFESTRNVWSTYTKFALERPPVTSNDHRTGGTWHLVHLDATSLCVGLSVLMAAYRWASDEFGGDFEPYKGGLNP